MSKLINNVYENLWEANNAGKINNHIEIKGSVIYIYDTAGNVKLIVKEDRKRICVFNNEKCLGYVNHSPKAISNLLTAIKQYC